MMKVNILGTDYSVNISDMNNTELSDADGICKIYEKEIVIRDKKYMCGNSEDVQRKRYEHVVRHELVHAVAQECGVQYGDDEALVDWIAHIIPIVNNAIVQINMLEFKNDMKPGD